MLPLSLVILSVVATEPLAGRAAGATSVDGLAPLQPGMAQAGSRFDLVLRPQEADCRLLLSDAETDAPVGSAKLSTKEFGKAGAAAVEGAATPGQYEGHYLAACPQAGNALVVEATAADGSDLFTFNATTPKLQRPEKKPKTASIPWWLGGGFILGFGVQGFRSRRGRRLHQGRGGGLHQGRGQKVLRGVIGGLLCVGLSGDAWAHAADEAGLPIDPGSELTLGQEIQFALGLRTARVTIASFPPPESLAVAAPRSSPSVPRSAVVERDGKKLVFVRLAPEQFVAREVTLGWEHDGSVAVDSGLQPGDLAVVAGAAFLRNGGSSGGSGK